LIWAPPLRSAARRLLASEPPTLQIVHTVWADAVTDCVKNVLTPSTAELARRQPLISWVSLWISVICVGGTTRNIRGTCAASRVAASRARRSRAGKKRCCSGRPE
jgi:hypothetical protein